MDLYRIILVDDEEEVRQSIIKMCIRDRCWPVAWTQMCAACTRTANAES